MKYLALALLALGLTAGCHGQQQPTPILSCPTPNIVTPNYAQILANPGVSTTTYQDAATSTVDGGTWCYFVQTLQAAGISSPSNVVMVTVPSAAKGVNLSWTAPAADGNSASYTYVAYRVAAISTTVPAITLAPPLTAENVVPAASGVPAVKLVAKLGDPHFFVYAHQK